MGLDIGILDRMNRAAKLDVSLYEEVEKDAAEGFSELSKIALNTIHANLTLEGAKLEAVYSEWLRIRES